MYRSSLDLVNDLAIRIDVKEVNRRKDSSADPFYLYLAQTLGCRSVGKLLRRVFGKVRVVFLSSPFPPITKSSNTRTPFSGA